VFPDGRPELVFHLGEPFADAATGVKQDSALLIGQMCGPARLQACGCVDVFGIRLRHVACRSVTEVAAKEITDRIMAVELVCRSARSELWHALGECRQPAYRVTIAERWLRKQVRDRIDPLAESAAAVLMGGRPLPGCGLLGDRQMRRRFSAAVGIGPALFSRIARFQRALQVIDCEPLASVAAGAGYADQSHFTRDFRQFAGCTPRQYVEQTCLARDFAQNSLR
jgi:hypothetical protein